MSMRMYSRIRKEGWTYAPFILPILALVLVGTLEWNARSGFVSHEVTFTDPSRSELAIMPASCASSPSYFHGALTTSGDGLGHVSATGQTEYGVTKNSVSLCITNTSGASYFVPTNTAAEMNAVKAVGTSIPGLQIW